MNTPTHKRQLAGRKTQPLAFPFLRAQEDAVKDAITLVEAALNELLIENLAGETGPVGMPTQSKVQLAKDPETGRPCLMVTLERHILIEQPPIVTP